MNLIFLAAAAAVIDPTIVVTAAREPVRSDLSGSAISILDRDTIDAVALPQVSDLLRLAPGVSVSQSGPLGSQTQVRLRGAESNHTLVFVDGIEVNDPAASGDFRFETLLSDGIERIEILRGPQSALWGSEAIGGVVSVTTRVPGSGAPVFGHAEGGSFGTYRVGGGVSIGDESGGIVAQADHAQSRGIDTFGLGGERDGYENLTLSLKGVARPSTSSEVGAVIRYTSAESEFDGSDPVTFLRADTLDETRIRGLALRGYGQLALLDDRWTHRVELQHLGTDNINRDGPTYLNRSDATRRKAIYQSSFETGPHRLTAAFEHEKQKYRADDNAFFGGTNQRQSREQNSLVGEYRLALDERFAATASIRRDDNDRFANATTWRAAAAGALGAGFRAHASYGEGVTDPTFTEQFGFFPGSFVGNPNLRPESSRGFDVGLGWGDAALALDLTYFDADLEDEIVGTFDSVTFLSGVANATGKSRRNGVEASLDARATEWLRVAASYTWLDAEEGRVAGTARIREVRRARHSGSLTAIAELDRLRLAGSVAYVGKRADTDFDTFAAVTLGSYALVTLSGHYRLSESIELTARVENAGDADYQDVFAYRTPGLAAYGGLKVRWGL
jgi:vitamin B12 transporter